MSFCFCANFFWVRALVRAGASEVVRTHAVLPQGDLVLASLALPFVRAGSFAPNCSCVEETAQKLTGWREGTFPQLQKGIHCGLLPLPTTDC